MPWPHTGLWVVTPATLKLLADFGAKTLGYIAEPGYDPDGASIIGPEGRVRRLGGFGS